MLGRIPRSLLRGMKAKIYRVTPTLRRGTSHKAVALIPRSSAVGSTSFREVVD